MTKTSTGKDCVLYGKCHYNVQRLLAAAGLVAVICGGALAATTTFESGTEGWSVSGRDNISPTGGNPGANLDVELIDVFGAEIRNDSNPDFIGDVTRFGAPLRLSVDIAIESISFFGTEVPRDLVVELVDYNPPGSAYPYVSTYYNLGELSSSSPGWRRFEVTIADPLSTLLPAGWGGTGDEDPITFEPRLPAGRTFTSVLQSVDELRFTTFVPGFFFGFTNFVMQVDNPTVEAVPEPHLGLFGLAFLLSIRRAKLSGRKS